MPDQELPTEIVQNIEQLVAHYLKNRKTISTLGKLLFQLLTDSPKLEPQVHSLKWRDKDPEHLRDKLVRKYRESSSNGTAFDISTDNLFQTVNDLAGVRILHLHTSQLEKLDPALLEVLEEAGYGLIEGPIAFTWDEESREYLESIAIKVEYNPRMYTSVHYIVESNTKTKYTFEIQVRTLAEELWGEVDHKINYPEATDILACREQIRVLARMSSSCTRLVDSIFNSHASANESTTKQNHQDTTQ